MQCGGRDSSNDDEGRPRSENDAACGTRLICVHSPDCATPAAAAAPSPKIRDLGFFNPYQIMLSGEKYFKSPKKIPPPDCGIAATAAAPSPNISCTHDLSPPVSDCCTPRSENAAILWQFFCMIRFSSRIAADFCLTCTSLVQSALASDLRNDFPSSQ